MREEYLTGSDDYMSPAEKEIDKALRPLDFSDFTGQEKVVENLKIFVEAARRRGEALDHVLLHGPPGLGKTTLSHIIANSLNSNIKITSGPVLDKPSDLAGLLTNLEQNTRANALKTELGDMYIWYRHAQKVKQYHGAQARMPFEFQFD